MEEEEADLGGDGRRMRLERRAGAERGGRKGKRL